MTNSKPSVHIAAHGAPDAMLVAGYVYHVLNRAVGRATLFDKAADDAAFDKVLREAWERSGMRLLSYVVPPNHWRLRDRQGAPRSPTGYCMP